MFAAHQTTMEQTAQKKTQKPTNKKQKPANPEISLFQVVCGFVFVPKIITVCVPSRSAEIFPETYMFANTMNHVLVCLTYLLRTTIFPRQWRVEATEIIVT